MPLNRAINRKVDMGTKLQSQHFVSLSGYTTFSSEEVRALKFELALERFLKYLDANDRSAKTLYAYERDLCRFRNFYEKMHNVEWHIEDTCATDIEAYLYMLYEEKHLQPASRNRILHCLKSFYKYAHNRDLCTKDPTLSVKSIRYKRRDKVHLTKAEYQELIGAIENPLIRLVTETLWYTGIRISELVQLSVVDVRLHEGTIHVLGKGRQYRDVPVHRDLHPKLERYHLDHRSECEPWERFFATTGSGGLSGSYYNRILHDTTMKLGWSKTVTAHVLRHSFATQLMKNGVHTVVIQKLLGHDSIETTVDYTHADYPDLKSAINIIGGNSDGGSTE